MTLFTGFNNKSPNSMECKLGSSPDKSSSLVDQMECELFKKQKELLELKRKKLEIELGQEITKMKTQTKTECSKLHADCDLETTGNQRTSNRMLYSNTALNPRRQGISVTEKPSYANKMRDPRLYRIKQNQLKNHNSNLVTHLQTSQNVSDISDKTSNNEGAAKNKSVTSASTCTIALTNAMSSSSATNSSDNSFEEKLVSVESPILKNMDEIGAKPSFSQPKGMIRHKIFRKHEDRTYRGSNRHIPGIHYNRGGRVMRNRPQREMIKVAPDNAPVSDNHLEGNTMCNRESIDLNPTDNATNFSHPRFAAPLRKRVHSGRPVFAQKRFRINPGNEYAAREFKPFSSIHLPMKDTNITNLRNTTNENMVHKRQTDSRIKNLGNIEQRSRPYWKKSRFRDNRAQLLSPISNEPKSSSSVDGDKHEILMQCNSTLTTASPLNSTTPIPTSVHSKHGSLHQAHQIPPTDSNILKMIEEDPNYTINLDGNITDIRFYGNTAIIFLNWDDPRDISFHDGTSNLIVDDKHTIPLEFNSPAKEVILDGALYRLRLGVPSRELYVNGRGHTCQLNSSPVLIDFGLKTYSVRLEGPPASLNIGVVKRLDLVVGKIGILVDDEPSVPIFLDARPQIIEIDGIPVVLQFADNLETLLINGTPITPNYGGVSEPFIIFGRIHSFQFTSLPSNIQPGYVNIQNMKCVRTASSKLVSTVADSIISANLSLEVTGTSISSSHTVSGIPLNSSQIVTGVSVNTSNGVPVNLSHAVTGTSTNPTSIHMPVDSIGTAVGVPINSSHLATGIPMKPIHAVSGTTMNTSQAATGIPSHSALVQTPVNLCGAETGLQMNSTNTAATVSVNSLGNEMPNVVDSLNISELLKTLVNNGIVNTSKIVKDEKFVHEANLLHPETLKRKQPGIIDKLHSGTQCGSCSIRFPNEQNEKYSQHLDWHFRQNRKCINNIRSIHSRRWYHEIKDWIQFEEMENEKAQSWFETTQVVSNEDTKEILSSVAVVPNTDDFCNLCQDKFEQFFDDETEEWHLKNAIRIQNKVYHPVCYEGSKEMRTIIDLEEIIDLDDNDSEVNICGENTDMIETEDNNLQCNEISSNQISDSNAEIMHHQSEDEDTPADKIEDNVDDKIGDDDIQLIEQPIEEILIQDDIEPEPNLETLNMEEIMAEQSHLDNSPYQDQSSSSVPNIQQIDITRSDLSCNIDGNLEIQDRSQHIFNNKIKINIANLEQLSNDQNVKNDDDDDICIIAEIPSCEIKELTPVAKEVKLKPRLSECKLRQYPTLQKGKEVSSLCCIM